MSFGLIKGTAEDWRWFINSTTFVFYAFCWLTSVLYDRVERFLYTLYLFSLHKGLEYKVLCEQYAYIFCFAALFNLVVCKWLHVPMMIYIVMTNLLHISLQLHQLICLLHVELLALYIVFLDILLSFWVDRLWLPSPGSSHGRGNW